MTWTETLQILVNSKEIITTGGWILILAIVFAENGLFFAFFLPGDYLLFSAGLFCGTGQLEVPITWLTLTITLAAILGSVLGYYFGWFLGKKLMNRPDSLFFKREYLVKTRVYYIKFGGKTLIMSRFLPVVRTFAPILAGVVRMNTRRFFNYAIAGGVIWVFTLVLSGYFLGQIFPGLMNYLEYIILAFLAVTSSVLIKGYIDMNKKKATRA